jgi:pimeloyl-ACP methyl ester carboxylesterase
MEERPSAEPQATPPSRMRPGWWRGVVRKTAGPVHLVGHSFGALVGLAVALRGQVTLNSLAIAEAPAVELLRECNEDGHYRAFRATVD